ncbi:MAG: prephenate dehydrogenase (NADP(+)) [Heterodermia speciosa]|uniref:Prephenate dehydrogenase [NADP(+)] n=1 Tax=Heterodermia speciosa TaxID=116794 RepID=A0A8H3FBN5_9LECA|nr:MAG: prephenate dehydrogenase (NADP(+)) [Heterodermia speciosa]
MARMDEITVGIIGMGEMGKMYARRISAAGWKVIACDRPSKYAELKQEFSDCPKVQILLDGHRVSRLGDYIIYSVEAEAIDSIVALYGPSTKQGAVVGGQTSCKAPELAAFEKHLPEDVDIVSCHSLHGPKVDPKGQPLVQINHRASPRSVGLVRQILSCFGSKRVEISGEEHDHITADTQAVTHAAFLSMGTAWCANDQFPWETDRYIGGIENVKVNLMLRIYSNKWHVYAGLAILNPWAKIQIKQYAASVTELFKLMLGGERDKLEKRIKAAASTVFTPQEREERLLLSDEVLDRFSLGKPPKEKKRNNHLALLAMVDCWSELQIVPYDHMICSTPLFRLWLGVTQYLFRKPGLLDEVLTTAVEDHSFRRDDLEFTFAARAWSECVSFGDFQSYRDRFERIQEYFKPRFPEATRVGNEMINVIFESM